MRFILLGFTLFLGISFGSCAIASINDLQEKRAEKLCQIDPSYCGQND